MAITVSFTVPDDFVTVLQNKAVEYTVAGRLKVTPDASTGDWTEKEVAQDYLWLWLGPELKALRLAQRTDTIASITDLPDDKYTALADWLATQTDVVKEG